MYTFHREHAIFRIFHTLNYLSDQSTLRVKRDRSLMLPRSGIPYRAIYTEERALAKMEMSRGSIASYRAGAKGVNAFASLRR